MNITTPSWVRDAIFYQIFPDRFAKSNRFGKDGYLPKPSNLQPWGAEPTFHNFQGGDLLGVTEKLDYLVDLGINAIYFNPIFSSASNHRYHTFDYFNVDPILGGNRAFEEMLTAAHKKGIRVILDGVFNHASRGFFQFNHLMECGQESPYVDWFHVFRWPVNAFSEHEEPSYYAWWGMHSLPKFNTNTPAVREFLWRVGEYWLSKGIDGWRLDVPNEIDDDAFWQEFRRRCKAINPDAYIVGELWHEAHRWLQGDQFDAQMNYMFTRAAFGFFSGHNMDQTDTVRCGYGFINPLNGIQFAESLDQQFNHMYDQEIVFSNLNMLGSHDTPRTATVVRNDMEIVRLMYLLQMTVPGVPNIYYGDEIGMKGGHDPHCRGAFPWNDELSWDRELREAICKYIHLRKQHPSLRRGDFKILYASETAVIYRRQYEKETAVVAFNIGEQTEKIAAVEGLPTVAVSRLEPKRAPLLINEAVTLPPKSGNLWLSE